MKFHYYEETDSLYIDLGDAASVDSKAVADGVVADFDANGKLVGIDIDNASKIADLQHFVASGFLPDFRLEATA